MQRSRAFYFLLISVLLTIFWSFSAPNYFPVHKVFTLEEGLTVSEVAEELKELSIIRSPLLFKLSLRLFSPRGTVLAGDYFFVKHESVLAVARRFVKGDFGVPVKRVTLPEGVTSMEIAKIIKQSINEFDADGFVAEAEAFEGKLFPDTYFFPITVRPRQVVTSMLANFERKVAPLTASVASSTRSLDEIIVMASIIEEEARIDEVRRMISGILWKRIDEGMPLQVDAVFPYIIGKNTFELSLEDLKHDSPYNTYVNKGLPPGPISNPGLSSISAALNPTQSDYWFYLADYNGVTHYARNFEEHKINKARYLP